jgi:hypothetical protein
MSEYLRKIHCIELLRFWNQAQVRFLFPRYTYGEALRCHKKRPHLVICVSGFSKNNRRSIVRTLKLLLLPTLGLLIYSKAAFVLFILISYANAPFSVLGLLSEERLLSVALTELGARISDHQAGLSIQFASLIRLLTHPLFAARSVVATDW